VRATPEENKKEIPQLDNDPFRNVVAEHPFPTSRVRNMHPAFTERAVYNNRSSRSTNSKRRQTPAMQAVFASVRSWHHNIHRTVVNKGNAATHEATKSRSNEATKQRTQEAAIERSNEATKQRSSD